MKSRKDKIKEYEALALKLKEGSSAGDAHTAREIVNLEAKIEALRQKVSTDFSAWDRIEISRNPQRPQTLCYIQSIVTDFVEIHGDRLYRDDPAIIGGFGYIDGKKFVIIGMQKGQDTKSRLARNFGMPHPEGYRKALRLMEMAEKFSLPILCFIDTPGAYPGLDAEERGQGWAIATNLYKMARIKAPIIAVIIGEGCSGGALGIGIADVVGMLEHSYYSVISPEGCASILWKDAGMKKHAAEVLKLNAEDLLAARVIDQIIKEPPGGAHVDPDKVYRETERFIINSYNKLSAKLSEDLLEERYQKFRRSGVCVVDESVKSNNLS